MSTETLEDPVSMILFVADKRFDGEFRGSFDMVGGTGGTIDAAGHRYGGAFSLERGPRKHQLKQPATWGPCLPLADDLLTYVLSLTP